MRKHKYILLTLVIAALTATAFAEDVVVNRGRDRNTSFAVDTAQFMQPSGKKAEEGTAAPTTSFDPVTYTLGPNDVVEIEVMRHPEFSGKYPVNQEGKLQYKFVGDMSVKGMTKKQLEDKLKEALGQFVVSPEINVSIVEYGSKTFFVIGEVAAPGQFVMRSEEISLRDAIHLAGMPTQNASMRRCQIITPTENGRAKIKSVDLFALLYYGDLRKNQMIKPGEILYVPCTILAKAIRIISPVASVTGIASSVPESAATGKGAVDKLKGVTNINY